MKAPAVLRTACVLALASGCSTQSMVPLSPEAYVGEYVYDCADSGSPHEPDTLTLRADGKYVLVHKSGGHPVSKEEGVWNLHLDPKPWISLQNAGLPVQLRGQHIHLLIDDDLGWSYKKIG